MAHVQTYRDGTGAGGFTRIGEGTAYRSHYIRYLGNGLYDVTREGFHLSYAHSFDHARAQIDELMD